MSTTDDRVKISDLLFCAVTSSTAGTWTGCIDPTAIGGSVIDSSRHNAVRDTARVEAMPRWEQGSADRLTKAALELFEERGFENTSVVEIAARARVTTRTFFRYFPDKSEVLFAESDRIRTALVQAILDAPDVTEPLQVVTTILAEFDWSVPGIELQRRRHAVIAASPGLLERDLIKQNDIAIELVQALRRRGVEENAARLATRVGIQVFATAYAQWVERDDGADLRKLTDATMDLLQALVPANRALGESGKSQAL
jgi:AcrR family transcriptional regulator